MMNSTFGIQNPSFFRAQKTSIFSVNSSHSNFIKFCNPHCSFWKFYPSTRPNSFIKTLAAPIQCSKSLDIASNHIKIENEVEKVTEAERDLPQDPFIEKGKIFVGNLPPTATKEDINKHFSQCGFIERIILIRSHNRPDTNQGYCFIFYGGDSPNLAANLAVDVLNRSLLFDKPLHVKLDDGRRLRDRQNRMKFENLNPLNSAAVPVDSAVAHKSSWHETRYTARQVFRQVLKSNPSDIVAVTKAFQSIQKPVHGDWCLLIKYHSRRKDKHSARSAFESMRASNIDPNSFSYTALVHAYASSGDMKGAMNCLDEMLTDGISIPIACFGTLISGFAKLGDIQSAENWYDKFKESKLEPNSIFYCNIISAFSKAEKMSRAEMMVEDMISNGLEPTLPIYNALLAGYVQTKNHKAALSILDQIKESAFSPDPTTCFNTVKLYIDIGDIEEAEKTLINFQKSSSSLSLSSPSGSVPAATSSSSSSFFSSSSSSSSSTNEPTLIQIYAMIMHAYVRNCNFEKVAVIFETLILNRMQPDAVIFNIIIHSFCLSGDIKRAVEILPMMEKVNVRPTPHTFSTLINAYANKGDLASALGCLDQMKRFGSVPTTVVYNTLIQGFMKQNKMEDVDKLLEAMDRAHLSRNAHTYTILINGYANANDLQSAFRCFHQMQSGEFNSVSLNERAYGALIKACCKCGRMQTALTVLAKMETSGMLPNMFIYNSLIDGYARKGDVLEASNLLQSMRLKSIQPDVITYTSLVNACCLDGDMQRAMEVLEEMKNYKIDPNLTTFTILIQGWLRVSNLTMALKTYEAMKEVRVKPDVTTFHVMITWTLTHLQSDEALAELASMLVSEMARFGYVSDRETAVHWSKLLAKAKSKPEVLVLGIRNICPYELENSENEREKISECI